MARRPQLVAPLHHLRKQLPLAILLTSWAVACPLGCSRSRPAAPSAEAAKQAPLQDAPASEPPPSTLPGESAAPLIALTDASESSQLRFQHKYQSGNSRFLAEAVTGALASFDFDGDGLLDIYFLNGGTLPRGTGESYSAALYQNLGDFRFREASIQSHAGDRGYGMGIAVADYNADGLPDMFINNFGSNALYRNNGDGTFTEVSQSAGLAGGDRLGAGACFLDADRDGLLDLYVANYVKDSIANNPQHTTEGLPSYPGPLDFQPDHDQFYHNVGDGRFVEQSQTAGVAGLATASMGVLASDFNDDGAPDIFVGNDVERNLLLQNDGTGKFWDAGIQAGVAFSLGARRNGNMGVDCGDYNGDGRLDLIATTFSNDTPVLYRNQGHGSYADETRLARAGIELLPHANWGVAFVDIDNDSDEDLVIANGHTDPNVGRWAFNTSWKVANTLLLNDGEGRYQDISSSCGDGLQPVESSRGLVAEDFDNDGDLDLVVLNALTTPTAIRNDSDLHSNWLQLQLIGNALGCRDATGARVELQTDTRQLVKEVHSGRGYQSSFGQRLHFGVADTQVIPHITIRWPSGQVQKLKQVAVNQQLVIQQPHNASE
ncbi:CRTAC1 family protein [Aureliella helgolandensis]|uniref:ASPIC and UnbV n=1 Tax=Aureliella helgolandensis TaxID=2527968 RepID=A0A518GGR7_9BACT|nr:CRTAC1 family protein [Aureliella helgolandensis]QDV27767.1 ASPIC and UnbV [Aureliella helgolandensis]